MLPLRPFNPTERNRSRRIRRPLTCGILRCNLDNRNRHIHNRWLSASGRSVGGTHEPGILAGALLRT